ncbi:hypothetical protein M3664_04730 [Paenibacillus lautus]|uniref:hypothetical protein n=1 Tax=Paenibacillus lautus TaxID=1401 RepID=UPI002041C925|nr:hypothetical protein [Paenibacillus lautus]MCM3257087.1 hypothetical protein [Paenibacillus lautus]
MEQLIYKVASNYREIIESIHWSEFPSECQLNYSFPHGACSDVSMLLGKYLLDKYGIDCEHVTGSTEVAGMVSRSHAWLEVAGYKIDITADQFEDIDEKVILVKTHPLYEDYIPNIRRKMSSCFPEELKSSYEVIMEKIEDNSY